VVARVESAYTVVADVGPAEQYDEKNMSDAQNTAVRDRSIFELLLKIRTSLPPYELKNKLKSLILIDVVHIGVNATVIKLEC